jgi:hypothetical protein
VVSQPLLHVAVDVFSATQRVAMTQFSIVMDGAKPADVIGPGATVYCAVILPFHVENPTLFLSFAL